MTVWLAGVRMATTQCNECCPPTHQYIPRHTEGQTNHTLNCSWNGGLQESSSLANQVCLFPQNRLSVLGKVYCTLLHSLPLWAEGKYEYLLVFLLPFLWFAISASVSITGIKSPIKVLFMMYGQVLLSGWAQGPPSSPAWTYPFSPGTSKNTSVIQPILLWVQKSLWNITWCCILLGYTSDVNECHLSVCEKYFSSILANNWPFTAKF